MTILKLNDFNMDVFMLQMRLGLWPTGYFDPRMQKEVKAFQKAHKLKADGEVGPLTRKALDLKPANKNIAINPLKPWLTIAQSQIGIKENEGWWLWSDNRKIVEYHHTTKFSEKATHETPWCAAYVNWVMQKSGRVGMRSAAAKAWLDFADKVTTPEPGDIVIVRDKKNEEKYGDKSDAGYHVGFYISSPPGRVRILGGNQGTPGEVSEVNFLLTDYIVKGYRRPKGGNVAMLMQFGTVQGGSTLKGNEGQMQISTFNFQIERAVSMGTGVAGRGPGVPSLSQIAITRMMDKSMPGLLQATLKGTAGVDATITIVSTGKTMREIMKYELHNAILSAYANVMHADEPPVQALMLGFSSIAVTCTNYDASGKACSPLRVAYDVSAAKLA